MTSDSLLKVIFGIVFVIVVTVATRTARRATRAHGGSINQLEHEVSGLLAVRAGLGLIFYAALGVWLLAPKWAAWSSVPLPLWARWTGVSLLGVTVLYFTWSFHTLGVNYRGGVGLYTRHTLETRGPYALVRHPIYLGFVVIMVLLFLVSANWVLAASGLILVASIAIARIPIEEEQLRERFGSDWEDYRLRTGCFLPHFGVGTRDR